MVYSYTLQIIQTALSFQSIHSINSSSTKPHCRRHANDQQPTTHSHPPPSALLRVTQHRTPITRSRRPRPRLPNSPPRRRRRPRPTNRLIPRHSRRITLHSPRLRTPPLLQPPTILLIQLPHQHPLPPLRK